MVHLELTNPREPEVFLDSLQASRLQEFLANKQIHWADSDSHRKLKQSGVSSANQLSPVKRLEQQLHSASLPSNQLWEDLQRLDRARARHQDLVFSNPRHKGGCSEDIQHPENHLEQVFLEHPPH